jgi:hypothetical protein
MPIGALHLLGLPGEDYEAKGAVQMALDNFDCGLRKHPPWRSGSIDSSTYRMSQDARKIYCSQAA